MTHDFTQPWPVDVVAIKQLHNTGMGGGPSELGPCHCPVCDPAFHQRLDAAIPRRIPFKPKAR